MNNKKLIAILTLLCFMFTFMPVAVFADDAASTPVQPVAITPDYSWYSTTESAYTIQSVEQLAGLAKITQGNVVIDENVTITKDDFSGKTVTLTENLTFGEGQYWYDSETEVNFCIKNFAGTFDGNEKTIIGLKFKDINATGLNLGLFSVIKGVVKDLNLETVTANVKTANIDNTFGSIAYKVEGSAINCHVEDVTVNCTTLLRRAGGMFGEVHGTATTCTAVNVTFNSTYAAASTSNSSSIVDTGGLIGVVGNGANINNCNIENSNIICNDQGNVYKVGGLIGRTSSNTTVTNCYAKDVNISVGLNLEYVGGFVGHAEDTTQSTLSPSTITACRVDNVTLKTKYNASKSGGFVGEAQEVTIKDCTANNIIMSIGDDENDKHGAVGGFVGQSNKNGTLGGITFENCTLTGLNMTVSGKLEAGIGGFITATGFSTEIKNCSVSGIIDASKIDATGAVGGFLGNIGWNNGVNCTITGCIANVNIIANGAAGGFVASAWPNANLDKTATLSVTDSTATGNVTSTNGAAGGFVGVGDRGTFTNCITTGKVSSENGVAGGLIGYIEPEADGTDAVSFITCTPATELEGVVTNEVANHPTKDYSHLDNEGNPTSYVCHSTISGYDVGFSSIQAAVDAGATTITLLNNVSGDFTLNGADHKKEQEKLKDFVLNLNDKTFNGTVHIYHSIESFTAKGTAEGSNILLTAPLGEHDIFDGWCSGTGEVGATAAYADKSADGMHWIIVPGKEYHTHFTPSGYKEIPAEDRHLNFGNMTYGDTVPEAQSITFTYEGAAENMGIKGFEPNPYFIVSGIGTLTATIRPNGNLDAGTYNERIYIIMHDGSSHEIWANVEVKVAVDDTVTENQKPSTGGGFSGSYNYPVNAGDVDGAKVTFSDNNAVAGETVTITVTPDSGKQVDEVIVTDKDGNVIPVTKVGDNKYSFVMPAGKVNVAVTTEDIRYDNKIVLQIGNRNVVVNGKAFSNDVAPVIQGDRTLVPIRVIVEVLGGEVDWNEATRTVTITIDGKVLTLVIDEMIPGFGQGATIMDSRTYVPIRYVAEYVGAYVEWIAETQQIVILK